ncbi:hypothetical protein ACB092_11G258500 [Castanea dentata]
MAIQGPFLLCFLGLACLSAYTEGAKPSHSKPLNSTCFPNGFIFGAGSAAYQGDIKLMKRIGLDSFRFSISWSRILITYFTLWAGIKPLVTLFHFDTSQALEDEYGGILSPKIVKDYLDYVDFCFKTFGDQRRMGKTRGVNFYHCTVGIWGGENFMRRCSIYVGNCTAGNSATEPYIVAHNLLLAHGGAVKLYKDKYQPYQHGKIGISIVTHWFVPKYQTSTNRKATYRVLDFFFGCKSKKMSLWIRNLHVIMFAHPVIYGDYPKSMKSSVGNRLPRFTEAQSKLLQGSLDFLGVNYYTTNYVESAPSSNGVNVSYVFDRRATLTTNKDGTPIGTPTALNWLFIYPKGLRELLLYIKENYNNPVIYITEDGMADANNRSLPIKDALKDSLRIRYHYGHLSYLLKAIKEGVNVKGYYVWSFFDDFEWDAGYTVQFGLIFVDFNNNLRRYLKYSAYLFKLFLLK